MSTLILIALSFIRRIFKGCITITWMIQITCVAPFFTWVTKCMRQTGSFFPLLYTSLYSVFKLTCQQSFLLLWLPICHRASLVWLHAGLSFSQAVTSYLGLQSVLWPAPNWAISALRGKRRDERVNYSNEGAAMQRAVREREARQKPCSVAPFWSIHG